MTSWERPIWDLNPRARPEPAWGVGRGGDTRSTPGGQAYQLRLLPLVPILLGQQVADDLHKVLEGEGRRASEKACVRSLCDPRACSPPGSLSTGFPRQRILE